MSGSLGNSAGGDGGQSQRHELFISYSHEDEHWLEKLRTHLKPLESLYGLERWDDSLIQPGDKWLEEIETALARAQVALLLVSPDFLASDFIQRKELPELLQSAEKDGLKIIWLPLRPSSWELYPDIRQYQAIISPAKTLAQMSEVDQDLSMVEITKKIQKTFEELRTEQKALLEKRAKELQDEENHRAEQEALRHRPEDARLEQTQAESETSGEVELWRAEAERLAREKEEWQQKAQGSAPSPQSAAEELTSVAQQLKAEGRLVEAEPLYRQALAIDEASFGPDHPIVAVRLYNLALLLQDTNRHQEAEPLYRRGVAIEESSNGPNHPNVAIQLNNLALLLQATNRLAEAEPLMRRALAIDEASYGNDHPKVAIDLNNLAGLLKDTGRLEEAELLYRRALLIEETTNGPNHPHVGTYLYNLAILLWAAKRLAEAEPLLRRALEIDKVSYNSDNPIVAQNVNNLARLLQEMGIPEAEVQERQQTFQPAPSAGSAESAGSALIEIPATKGWLEREGNQWQKREAPITVPGFLEQPEEGFDITMIQIPGGEFLMGSPESEEGRSGHEAPQHRVKLSTFFLGKTPVTQAQWKVVAGWQKVERDLKPDPSHFKGATRPVEQVSWEEAMEFCLRLRQRTQREYTLPSEAQWEYACRAESTAPFSFGETLTAELADYNCLFTYGKGPRGVTPGKTCDVGSFPANAWGLQDMHGNVWEWCLDTWHDNYNGEPTDGASWTAGAMQWVKVMRGGSWCDFPKFCRSASRGKYPKGSRYMNIGFRLFAPLPEGSS